MSQTASAFSIAALAAAMSILASSVEATDLTEPMGIPVDWSGTYIGIHGGAGFSDVDIGPGSLSPPGTPGSSLDADGTLFGLLAGVNFQHEQFVYGLEGDISFGEVDATHPTSTLPSYDIDFVGTIRGRLGFAFDRWHLFGTAGIGFVSADAEERARPDKDSDSHVGFVAGAGVEYQFTDQVVVRVEYMHGSYDTRKYTFTPPTHSHNIDIDTDVVRGALIWRLAN